MSANPFPPGYDSNLIKFGRATGLAIGTETIVWNTGGVYNGILAAESSLSIVSDSNLDKVGGGGATLVTFAYQGEDGIEKRGLITLNGTTPVVIPNILADVSYTAWVVGSENTTDLNGANIGNIKCYQTATPANILWHILAGQGYSLMCFYRVPSNKFLSLSAIDAFPQGNKPTIMRLRVKTNKAYPWRVIAIGDALDAAIPIHLEDLPQVVRPMAYIAITAEATIVNTEVSAYFAGRLKDYSGADYYGGVVPF